MKFVYGLSYVYASLITLSMLIHSHIRYWARYRYINAHREPGVKISCFNPSHHSTPHGNSAIRTNTDTSATILSQRQHQPLTRKCSENSQQIWKIYFIYPATDKIVLPAALLQPTDQTSALSCIYARILTKTESEE